MPSRSSTGPTVAGAGAGGGGGGLGAGAGCGGGGWVMVVPWCGGGGANDDENRARLREHVAALCRALLAEPLATPPPEELFTVLAQAAAIGTPYIPAVQHLCPNHDPHGHREERPGPADRCGERRGVERRVGPHHQRPAASGAAGGADRFGGEGRGAPGRARVAAAQPGCGDHRRSQRRADRGGQRAPFASARPAEPLFTRWIEAQARSAARRAARSAPGQRGVDGIVDGIAVVLQRRWRDVITAQGAVPLSWGAPLIYARHCSIARLLRCSAVREAGAGTLVRWYEGARPFRGLAPRGEVGLRCHLGTIAVASGSRQAARAHKSH